MIFGKSLRLKSGLKFKRFGCFLGEKGCVIGRDFCVGLVLS